VAEASELDGGGDRSNDERRYGSMADAFRDKRTSVANQQFLSRLLARIDVEGYYRYSDHFRVLRRDGGPWLEVHHGGTNGFRSPEEVTDAIPNAVVTPSTAREGTWRVGHPDRAPDRDADGLARRARRPDPVPCPECGDILSVSGVCNNPDCANFGIENT
jgi:hypothetical protein